MKLKQIKKNNKGFTFVELLLVLAILCIVMVYVIKIMSTSTVTYTKTNADLTVQEATNHIINQMSVNIMQATCFRVGTDSAVEYVRSDTKGAVKYSEDAADYGRLLDNVNQGITDINGADLYAFERLQHEFTGSSDDSIVRAKTITPRYIYMEYSENQGTEAAPSFEDSWVVYSFKDDKIYSLTGKVADGAITDGAVTDEFLRLQVEKDSNIFFKNIEKFDIDIDGSNQCVDLKIKIEKRNRSYETSNIVKFRNSNILSVK